MLQGLVLYFYLPRIGTPPCKIRYVVCGMGVWVCALQWQSRAINGVSYPFNTGYLSLSHSGNPGLNGVSYPFNTGYLSLSHSGNPGLNVSYRAPPCKIRHIHPVCVLQGELSIFTRPPRAGTVRYVIYTQYIV